MHGEKLAQPFSIVQFHAFPTFRLLRVDARSLKIIHPPADDQQIAIRTQQSLAMSAPFLRLSSELRNLIYKYVLLIPECITPASGYHSRQDLNTGLLRVNRSIHHEATPLFYGQNTFDLTDCIDAIDAVSFLEKLGRNATFLKSISMDFPGFAVLETENVVIEEGDTRVLSTMEHLYTNLSRLTMSVYSTHAAELRLDALDHNGLISEALAKVDRVFRGIQSLREMRVIVYEEAPNDYTRREMTRLEWQIITIPEESEFGGGISDYDDNYDDDYDHRSMFDSISDEDYDIDNDSDFWRRAAD